VAGGATARAGSGPAGPLALLGWAGGGDAQTREKDQGPREDFAGKLGRDENSWEGGLAVSFSFLFFSYFYFLFKASKHI
jgi:hypothetical protein